MRLQIQIVALLAAILVVSVLTSGRIAYASQPTFAIAACPKFDPSDFSHPTKVTNQFWPLVPGTSYIYYELSNGKPGSDQVLVTHKTISVDGIRARVVDDSVYLKGHLTEITHDYYAQDNSGNVWYMGESAFDVKHGQLVPSTDSWLAGTHGAIPGYIMEANPKVGDFYCQEHKPGVAEDQARVVSTSSSVCVPYVCSHGNALVTKETSPLEPAVTDYKTYLGGIGNVKEVELTNGSVDDFLQLVTVQHL